MKRLPTLVLSFLMVLLLSVIVFADETGPYYDEPPWKAGDGIFENYTRLLACFLFEEDSGPQYINIENISTSVKDSSFSSSGSASIKIPARANIPCFIEIEVLGNTGYSHAKTLNIGALYTLNYAKESEILFDIRYGGFMDKDWSFLNTDGDDYHSIRPRVIGDPDMVYIHGCDLWKVSTWANVQYGLTVSANALALDSYSLPIDMRYTVEGAVGWFEGLDLDTTDKELGPWSALTDITHYFQFRVPYAAVPSGTYNGDVIFMAHSL